MYFCVLFASCCSLVTPRTPQSHPLSTLALVPTLAHTLYLRPLSHPCVAACLMTCSHCIHNPYLWMHVTCCGRFMCVLRFVCLFKVGYLSNKRGFWVVVERNCIHFTTHFIECLVVETKRFVGTVNVILTRQTCGQRSSRAAQSKRRVIESYFSKRICHMFQIPKCRGDWDLGLCTSEVLAKRKLLCNGNFRGKKTWFVWRKNRK